MEGKAMTHGSGYFGFESIVYMALTILVVTTLSIFAYAAVNLTAVA
jgi:hypothetical protein